MNTAETNERYLQIALDYRQIAESLAEKRKASEIPWIDMLDDPRLLERRFLARVCETEYATLATVFATAAAEGHDAARIRGALIESLRHYRARSDAAPLTALNNATRSEMILLAIQHVA